MNKTIEALREECNKHLSCNDCIFDCMGWCDVVLDFHSPNNLTDEEIIAFFSKAMGSDYNTSVDDEEEIIATFSKPIRNDNKLEVDSE